VLLKYFYDQKLAHASYMVGCQATGEALIVDPGRDIDPYLREAERNDLRITGVTETHIHADFVSGARELAVCTRATLYLSDEGDENWKYQYLADLPHRLLRDGDRFMVGNIALEVMHSPGHTPEHICLLLTDTAGANRPMGMFTGDFVFVGAVGRPDLLEKAAGVSGTALAGARQLFASLQRFKQLPDYLQIWPAHGAGSACGKGLGAVPSSTVGYEKLFSPAFAYTSEGEFVQWLLDDQPEPPRYFAVMKRVNKEGPAIIDGRPLPAHLPADRLPELVAQRAQIVDTRRTVAFAGQYLPGTINIPLDELPNWAGWLLDYERPYYLLVDSDQLPEAVRDLRYIGADSIAGYFELAALHTLAERGVQMRTYEHATPDKVAAGILSGDYLLLDVRNQTEWEESHIPGARHVMLGYLAEHAGEFFHGKPVVLQCRSGNRSAIGASILAALGARDVVNMQGGIRDWQAAGLPVE